MATIKFATKEGYRSEVYPTAKEAVAALGAKEEIDDAMPVTLIDNDGTVVRGQLDNLLGEKKPTKLKPVKKKE